MPQSKPVSVDDFLGDLPAARSEVMGEVRELIRANLPDGYEEAVNGSMLCYQIPLERYPETYNGQPLGYVAFAAQKSYFALYLLGAYMDPRQRKALEEAFAKAGKKMDMGKSCLRFRTTDDLPMAALAKLIAGTSPDAMIALYEQAHPPKKSATKKPASRKAAAKKSSAPAPKPSEKKSRPA